MLLFDVSCWRSMGPFVSCCSNPLGRIYCSNRLWVAIPTPLVYSIVAIDCHRRDMLLQSSSLRICLLGNFIGECTSRMWLHHNRNMNLQWWYVKLKCDPRHVIGWNVLLECNPIMMECNPIMLECNAKKWFSISILSSRKCRMLFK